MYIESYIDFLEEEDDIRVKGDEMEMLPEEDDIHVKAKYKLDVDGEEYRLTIEHDASPNGGNADYTARLSQKNNDGHTNWAELFEEEYNLVEASNFRDSLKGDLDEEIPEFNN